MNSSIFKSMKIFLCIVLSCSLVISNVSAADVNSLAPQSLNQSSMMTPMAEKEQRVTFDEAALKGSVLTILDLLFDRGVALEHLHSVMDGLLETRSSGIDLSGIFPVRSIAKQGSDQDGGMGSDSLGKVAADDVVVIPYTERSGERRVIYAALNSNRAIGPIVGEEWNVSDRFTIKNVYSPGVGAAGTIIGSIQDLTDADPEPLLRPLDLRELGYAVKMLEGYAGRTDIHAFKRFRVYMILFGIYYKDASGKTFLKTAVAPDDKRAALYKDSAFSVYGVEIDRLLDGMLEENGLKPASSLDEYRLRIPDNFEGVVARSGVRIDMSSGFGGDHVLLAMELGSRAVNASILLKDERSGKYDYPIEVKIRKLSEPIIRLRSVDMGGGEFVINTIEELFAFDANKEVMLAKAAIVSSGIVPSTLRNDRSVKLSDILRRLGGGFEVVTEVKGIPNGSGLGTSSALASTLVSALVKFSGQSGRGNGLTDRQKLLNVMRTAMVEKTLGSFGGYADACNIFPAIKEMTTRPGVFLPAYEPIPLKAWSEKRLYDTLVLTDGGNRQFSGDAAWQFTGLWAMGLSRVRQARVNTTEIGRIQAEAMRAADIQKFGMLEGEDYKNRVTICPAGDNEYVRSVNGRLIKELGKGAFYYDVSGARGGAGGCYWLNTAIVKRPVFVEAFLRISKEEQARLRATFDFGGEPRIYDYKLNDKGIDLEVITPTIDLDAFDDKDPGSVRRLREALGIDARYEAFESDLNYNVPAIPASIDENGVKVFRPERGLKNTGVELYQKELPDAFGDGLSARIVHIEKRPKENDRYSLVRFKYGGMVLSCGPRQSPYSVGHVVCGVSNLPQTLDAEGKRLKTFLVMSRVFGSGYEGFFNGTAPTSDDFHAQFIKARMTIWDAKDLSAWPLKAEEVSGYDMEKVVSAASRIYNRYASNTSGIKASCDILFRFEEDSPGSVTGKYRALLVPRLNGKEDGCLVPHSEPFTNDKNFGTLGGVEVGGCFMAADKTMEAFEMLTKDGGALYKRAMREVSWDGDYCRGRFEERLGKRVSTERSPSSIYRYEEFSPEESLYFLISYLLKSGEAAPGLGSIRDRFFSLKQDEFEPVAMDVLGQIRKIFLSMKRDRFFVMTSSLQEEVYNAYFRLFKYMYPTVQEVDRELGEWRRRASDDDFINRSVFPDGKGSTIIDNYGMSGIWRIAVEPGLEIANKRLMRLADAMSIAVSDSRNYKAPSIVDILVARELPSGAGLVTAKSGGAAFSSETGTFYFSRAFLDSPRNDQAKAISELIGDARGIGSAFKEPGKEAARIASSSGEKPSAVVVSLAMAEVGRARDYLHHKFNYRVQAFAQALARQSRKAEFTTIENRDEYGSFLKRYAGKKEDIVVLSLYQLKPAEIDILYDIVPSIKKINPTAIIVVEGAITGHAKQTIALLPDIDIMVRGEADAVVADIMDVKRPGEPLTPEGARYIAGRAKGGIFIRTDGECLVSNLDKTVINDSIGMVDPTRSMVTAWYTEHGCPHRCAFCRKHTGGSQHKRIIGANERIDWMIKRLSLELDMSAGIGWSRLRDILASQAGSEEDLRSAKDVKLLPDTYIGRDKVEIVIASENATVNRVVMMDFCRQVRELGLDKYFKIKIADSSVLMLMKGDVPDLEYMKEMSSAGIYFIGMGSENMSRSILADLGKGFDADHPEGYTADAIIAVNKALLEAGFSPACIRHNMLLNTPDSSLADVKSSMLLMFLSPVYNSMLELFSNGWGNARNSRIYAMEGSLWTAADTMRYAENHKDLIGRASEEYAGKAYALVNHFYVSRDMPEYVLRSEDSPLNYADERIHPLSSEFGYPHFYRYRLSDFIAERLGDRDIERAIRSWRDPGQGREVNTLAGIVDRYRSKYGSKPLYELMKMIKYHMVASGSLSFIDYAKLLASSGTFPELLEACDVSKLVSEADRYMMPGACDPEKAMDHLLKAGFAANVVKALSGRAVFQRPGTAREALPALIEGLSLSAASNIAPDEAGRLIGDFTKDAALGADIMTAWLAYREKFRRIMAEDDYLSRLSYPDQQVFEYIKYLSIFRTDSDVFDTIVARMNLKRLEFQAAIKDLVIEKMSYGTSRFTADDYAHFVESVKEYGNVGIFGRSGILARVGSSDSEIAMSALRDIVGVLSREESSYIIRAVAINLLDMSTECKAFDKAALLVPANVIAKLEAALQPGPSHERDGVVFGGRKMRIAFIREDLDRAARERALGTYLDGYVRDPRIFREVIYKSDWLGFYLKGERIVALGDIERDKSIVERYGRPMNLEDTSIATVSRYISRLAEQTGRVKEAMRQEIARFYEDGPEYPTRYMMTESEIFLYALPFIKLMADDPELRALMLGRGMEAFYHAFLMATGILDREDLRSRTVYSGIFRHGYSAKGKNYFISQSILPLLLPSELNETVSPDDWEDIRKAMAREANLEELDRYLANWDIKGGLEELIGMRPSRRQAIIYLASFGLDERLISLGSNVRSARLGSTFTDDGFLGRSEYPVEDIIRKVVGRPEAARVLTAGKIEKIADGLRRLAGSRKGLLSRQRELIHGYARIFGYAEDVADIKNNTIHKARPALNILLRGTRTAERMASKKFISVDETNISGVSLLISEIVIRAFNADAGAAHKTYNISQRTTQTDAYYKESGVLDHTSGSGIWIQEDINDEFFGSFLSLRGKTKRYHTFRALSKLFGVRGKASDSADLTAVRIRQTNDAIDAYIAERGLFGFIDKMPSLRFEARQVKREFLKYLIRMKTGDNLVKEVQDAIFLNSVARGVTPGEADSPVMFKFKDMIQEVGMTFDVSKLPSQIVDLEGVSRYADIKATLDGYIEKAKERVGEYANSMITFSSGRLRDAVAGYINGAVDFDEVKKVFYAAVIPQGLRYGYVRKEVALHDGKLLSCRYYGLDGNTMSEFFGAHQLDGPEAAAHRLYLKDRLEALGRILKTTEATSEISTGELRYFAKSLLAETEEALRSGDVSTSSAATSPASDAQFEYGQPAATSTSSDGQSASPSVQSLPEILANNSRSRVAFYVNEISAFLHSNHMLPVAVRASRDECSASIAAKTRSVISALDRAARHTDKDGKAPVKVPSLYSDMRADAEKALDRVDVDSIVSSLVVKAVRADARGEKLVIGLDLELVSGEKAGPADSAMIGELLHALRLLQEKLEKMKIMNLVVINRSDFTEKGKGDDAAIAEWADAIEQNVARSGDYSNVVVFGAERAVSYFEDTKLSRAKNNERAFLSKIEMTQEAGRLGPGGYLGIVDFVGMLALTLEAASGKDVPEQLETPYFNAVFDQYLRRIVFMPRADKIDYEELRRINRMKIKLLAFA